MIKVVVNGALGKVGREVTKAVKNSKDMTLERELDVKNDLGEYLSRNKTDV
ncbi:MAG: 4-hydroxy-tetrahydrodipicolinate reductase, partial [Candidatus Margulisbacteria bacterium]|nr:4-hydroxy-tetrahydrodipicolinate reductase [Candidatus Margulisiibacteriota bacterium]